MGAFNRKNAAVGWAVSKIAVPLVKRKVKKKLSGSVRRAPQQSAGPSTAAKGGIAATAVGSAVGAVAYFVRRRKRDDS